MDNIISVAYFTKNETIRNAILKSDEIRQKTLKHCYSIAGKAGNGFIFLLIYR